MKLIQGNFIDNQKYINKFFFSDFFRFNLGYSDESNADFQEINRFIQQSRIERTRFKNTYVGPAVVDITEWASKPLNSKFDAFMYFMLDRTLINKDNEIIFVSELECSDEVKDKIEEYFKKLSIVNLNPKKERKSNIGFTVDYHKDVIKDV